MMVEDLTREEIKAGLESGSILLVDVREPHEFAAGHIPGSVSLPLSRFSVDDLPPAEGKRVVLSCAAGVRSMQAAMLAHQQGRAIDAHYRGGFKDWFFAGEPVEQG
ncbi:MAG: rhodanese-like domain-containing protein [Beijerinckiaceae bacterium]|nr:rhodanese-like domain-containing protein [Beijerinckiaceae bacterium]